MIRKTYKWFLFKFFIKGEYSDKENNNCFGIIYINN